MVKTTLVFAKPSVKILPPLSKYYLFICSFLISFSSLKTLIDKTKILSDKASIKTLVIIPSPF